MKQYTDFLDPEPNQKPDSYWDESIEKFEHSQNDPTLRQELLDLAFNEAIERFAAARGKSLNPQLDIDAAETKALGLADMTLKRDLLQDLRKEVQNEKTVEPQCSVCVPVAILMESTQNVLRTVELVKANSTPECPVELILWANAKKTDEDNSRFDELAVSRYRELTEAIAELTDESFSVSAALDILPDKEFSMSKVRSNYMDAVTIKSIENERGFTYPIIWLDADTTSLSRNAVEEVSSVVRNLKAYYAHMDLNYSIDWVEDDVIDDATKAVAINEVSRRQYVKTYGDRARRYTEETGLAFTLGVYMNSLGVDTSTSLSESGHLIERTRLTDRYEDPDAVVPLSILYPYISLRDLVKYVRSARAATSARRHYEIVKAKGAEGLVDVDASGYGEELYTDIQKHDPAMAITITGDDLKDVIHKNLDKFKSSEDFIKRHNLVNEEAKKKHLSQKVALALIKRHFDS